MKLGFVVVLTVKSTTAGIERKRRRAKMDGDWIGLGRKKERPAYVGNDARSCSASHNF